ncbi:alpha-amylase family protein [Isoptericola variabilis]|uniref:Maltose alpha-D-glucosyltransferase n=1 Tax=Isoptericola variabilis (strain 225) TaxID=743718 RepID=F6FQ99_ISOV2|nr:alpha-amylase family protein [Isoptericola variabilis]AEG42852.1 Maltose alpha-D-glucosyltransferase [Isoptericola variabilis 225]TWH30992.1 maltose alpha-D-glucosyltransferase/alpha-amylase [Isoptericola variabilis J7]
MTISPSWYGNAVIYQVDPRLFYDADGDGWGDLPGVIERLPYLRGLGTTAVWLLPFYVSPFRDGGYDVVDHLAVDPRLGDLADVARLLETADDMGIHVIVELVCQHTSDQHRWFQDARSSRTSRYRDYYVWSDEPVKTGVEPMFPEVEDDVWTWDSEAQQFYRHTFYSFEPDLALDNPRVRDELERIMTFWLRLGVSGFRVDAVPYMVERARQADPAEDGQWLVRQMRDVVTRQNAGAVLLGEADVEPLLWALDQQPDPPRHGQYAQWLRNNDELDLERLSDAERAEVLEAFAPQRRMQVYGRGIRRRLAPMLDGDARRIALAHAVLFSLPGPPILRYGDEIGMGDDLARSEREAVRTPMQWTDGRNAGFSQADPDDLVAPVISHGPYAYTRVNVADQAVHGGSLHNRVGALIRARLGLPETGLVRPEPVEVTGADGRPATSVLALRYAHGSSCVVMLANLADADVEVTLDADPPVDAALVDVLADQAYDRAKPVRGGGGAVRPRVRLAGYGYRWLRPRDRAVHDAPG